MGLSVSRQPPALEFQGINASESTSGDACKHNRDSCRREFKRRFLREFKRRQIKGSNFQGFQASYFAVEVAVVPAQNWRSG
jgi:hypothetical protein